MNKMWGTLLYLYCGSATPCPILYSSSIQVDRHVEILNPCNRQWVDNVIAKSKRRTDLCSTQGQDVTVALYKNLQNCLLSFFDLTFLILLIHRGSMCHIGQALSKRLMLVIFSTKRADRCLIV